MCFRFECTTECSSKLLNQPPPLNVNQPPPHATNSKGARVFTQPYYTCLSTYQSRYENDLLLCEAELLKVVATVKSFAGIHKNAVELPKAGAERVGRRGNATLVKFAPLDDDCTSR